jgi:LmbE family N-acetylglucosaminyl deacetylase
MGQISRRRLLSISSGLAGVAAAACAAPCEEADRNEETPALSPAPDDLPEVHRKKKLKVVFVGAHTDDWTVCGGTLARYAALGHKVLIISCTPGDSVSMADVAHTTLEKLASARRDQATKGAEIIGARIVFLKEKDLMMRVDPASYQEFNNMLMPESPDVVFAMWLMEFHPDHRAAGNLAYNAWLQSGMKFGLYFCETPGGTEMQPQQFSPTHYVDVGPVRDLRRESFLANDFIKDAWPESDLWAKYRGMEYGCRSAEAFVRVHTVATMPERNLYPNWWYWGGLRLAGK